MIDLHKAYASYLREAESNPAGDELARLTLGRDMVDFLRRGENALDAARQSFGSCRGESERSG